MGVRVLDALKPFMLGMEFIPFVVAPKMDTKAKKTYTYNTIFVILGDFQSPNLMTV